MFPCSRTLKSRGSPVHALDCMCSLCKSYTSYRSPSAMEELTSSTLSGAGGFLCGIKTPYSLYCMLILPEVRFKIYNCIYL